MEDYKPEEQVEEIDETEEIKNTPEEVEQEETETEETEETDTDLDNLSEEEIEQLKNERDEMGVSKYNRLKEAQRKAEKYKKEAEVLRQQQAQQQQQQQPQAEPTYTKEQLAEFYKATENPEHQAWAAAEYKKLERKEIVSEVMKEVSQYEQAKNYNLARSQAITIAQQSFPEAFVRDRFGNFDGWNYNSPLFQKMRQVYFSDPTITKHPYGIVGALKMASADLLRSQSHHQAQQNEKLKKSLKNLQKKTLVEGGVPEGQRRKSGYASAMENLRNKGDEKAATAALKEHFYRSGLFRE